MKRTGIDNLRLYVEYVEDCIDHNTVPLKFDAWMKDREVETFDPPFTKFDRKHIKTINRS